MNENKIDENGYDSSAVCDAHREIVKSLGCVLCADILNRLVEHDKSKYEEPEKSCYDKYVPMLKDAKYGSTEYYDIKKKMMEEGLSHHYSVNRHHPEHFKNGIEGMTLVDLFEYFIDTYAASIPSDTSYRDGLVINQKKYALPDELVSIFLNTVDKYFHENV